MENNLQFGKESMPSILKDPFKSNNITAIHIHYYPNDKYTKVRASVDFKNGDTKGTQQFSDDIFDDVVIKIRKFVDNL